MSIIVRGITSGADTEVDSLMKAVRVSVRPPKATSGYFRMVATSGLLTTVAAGSGTAGHLFAARWTHATKIAVLKGFAMRWRTITGFTAAQEMAIKAYRLTGYSVAHTGGTGLTLTAPAFKKDTGSGATNFGDLRIGTTGALTNGTHTIDGQEFLSDIFAELAAAATVQKGRTDAFIDWGQTLDHPLMLRQNEGIIVRNEILMGAGGTGRLIVEMDWAEIDSIAEWT